MRIIIDTREQLPYDFGEIPIVYQALSTGDYSIEGLEGQVSIERKSLPDLIASLGQERVRFLAEMERLKTYPVRRLLVEVDRASLVKWLYEGAVHPNSVTGTLDALDAEGIPVVYASDRLTAQAWCRSFLVRVHERLTLSPAKAYPALATVKGKAAPVLRVHKGSPIPGAQGAKIARQPAAKAVESKTQPEEKQDIFASRGDKLERL